MPISNSLFTILSRCRHFSSLPKLTKIPSKHRSKAIKEAQQTLSDHFYTTRSLPFVYAEHISKNALVSLSKLIVDVDSRVADLPRSLRKFIRYNPVNDFEFFYESIGIDYDEVKGFMPKNKFFFSEGESVLQAAYALSAFGFPWNKLGKLYKEESSIFGRDSNELTAVLSGFKEYGFSNTSVIGICMAFPFVLSSGALGGEIDALFDDLKRVFFDFDLKSSVEGNFDAWYEMCLKIRVFYDLGIEKGKLGDIIGEGKAISIFVEHTAEFLLQKVEYFSRFDVPKVDAALLLLQKPEIFGFDLETPLISVKGLLKHFGFDAEVLEIVARKYPYVMGRNRMANLPHVMRAMNLHSWFFNKIKDGDHKLLADYAMEDPDEDFNKEFSDELERIQVSRASNHTMTKVDFVLGIGFGENAYTVKNLFYLHGNGNELQERFSCLLRLGVAFSNLCCMVSTKAKILNVKPEILEQKVKFLREEMHCSLHELDTFPGYLCFNLENRIKPRFRFHMWLMEKGLSTRKYSIGSLVATSENKFIARIYGIHPAAVKHWLECYSNITSDE